MIPPLNTLRLAMYPEEWRELMQISTEDKARARAIAETFWQSLERDPARDRRIGYTTEAWRIDDGE
jgi:hypothetical protein